MAISIFNSTLKQPKRIATLRRAIFSARMRSIKLGITEKTPPKLRLVFWGFMRKGPQAMAIERSQLIKYPHFPFGGKMKMIGISAAFDMLGNIFQQELAMLSFGNKVGGNQFQNREAILLRGYSPAIRYFPARQCFLCINIAHIKPFFNGIKHFFVSIGNVNYCLKTKCMHFFMRPKINHPFAINQSSNVGSPCFIHSYIIPHTLAARKRYWGKEKWGNHAFRIIRLIIGVGTVIIGVTL